MFHEKKYKKPHRLTDLCRYCEYGLDIKKKLVSLIKDQNLWKNEFEDNEDTKFYLNTKNILNYFKNSEQLEKTQKILSLGKELVAIKFHRKIAKIQRDSYKKMKNDMDLLKDSIMIELDFKQKIVIGSSPRQVSSEYYSHIQKSLLGKLIIFIWLKEI